MAKRVEVIESQLSSYHTFRSKYYNEMRETVKKMTAPGKGLLAADESVGSCTKRFNPLGMENTAENRRQYRGLMLGADGLEQYISGVIFHEETLTQKDDNGVMFPESVARRGIVPGIKTDRGLINLLNAAPGEQGTEGIDGYVKRANVYYKQGARFCKWRNVYKIQNGNVSEFVIKYNARTLAQYAVLSQAAGLVPIVEPEVMIDGKHTQQQCQHISERVWSEVVSELHAHGVIWECCLLKPNMVVPGAESGVTATPQQVAEATVSTLLKTIPGALPGVCFLSGGLSEVQASEYLNAMNASSLGLPRPWRLTFSYARALQSSALARWNGKAANVPAARKVFLHRARMNSLASQGKYIRGDDDKESKSLYVKGHTY
jgi:fructose-bisphosphate aldolase class I